MKSTRFVTFVVLAFALCVAGAAVAQTVVDTEVKSGTVIGKTDHSVIIKMSDGVVREFEVPPGKTAMVDGKETTLTDLKIGTTLSATVHTVAKPVEVKTTTIRNGEVMKVNGSVLVYKENGKIFTKSIPAGYKFNVEGRGETSISDLHPDMKLTPTAVPVAAAAAPAPAPMAEPAAEPAKKKLPKTASPMPLVGLLGGLSLVAGAGLRRLRRQA